MAKVLLANAISEKQHNSDPGSLASNALRNFERLQRAAAKCSFATHALVRDPQDADLIIFAGSGDPYHRDVLVHPLTRKYRDRCFIVDSSDKIIPFLPGIYASIERRWYSQQRTRAGFYLNIMDRKSIDYKPRPSQYKYLFSFLGSVDSAPIRAQVISLGHKRAFLLDTSNPRKRRMGVFCHQEPGLVRLYANVMEESKFVLCPRGVGTSSWRLFETMKMGRVPVIISDQWVPPEGPDWNKCSIRICENQIEHIPEVLERYENNAEAMGMAAREQWDNWFSEPVCFHRIADWCNAIRASRNMSPIAFRWGPYCQLLRPYHARTYVGSWRARSHGRI
jgi:hypothetical protein